MSPLLDLTDANTDGFEPLPQGRYQAEIFEITMDETSNPDGKVPKGTPLIKVQYKVTEEPYENRRLFQQFVVPPDTHEKSKRAWMLGMIANFFMAMGFDETEVKSANFDPDLEDCKGRAVTITVSQRPYEGEMQNVVKGVRAPHEDGGAGELL
ncbi:MAG TPA: DUF669 domain-containing protein [Nitrososphaera sp.]|jgi:hypothetical protein